jgi:hypothetical protein
MAALTNLKQLVCCSVLCMQGALQQKQLQAQELTKVLMQSPLAPMMRTQQPHHLQDLAPLALPEAASSGVTACRLHQLRAQITHDLSLCLPPDHLKTAMWLSSQ